MTANKDLNKLKNFFIENREDEDFANDSIEVESVESNSSITEDSNRDNDLQTSSKNVQKPVR